MRQFDDSERYVVTGMGLVSPVGNDPETAWQAILAGEHGIQYARDTLFKGYESLPIYVAAPVRNFDLTQDPAFADRRNDIRGKWDTSQQFVLWSGAQALRMAGLNSAGSTRVEDHGLDPKRFGIYMGTGIGGANHLAEAAVLLEKEKEQYAAALAEGDELTMERLRDSTRINPKLILKTLIGRVAGTPSIEFGARAFWEGVLKECASGNAAIISAIEAIKLGKADVVLAGGVEGDITPYSTGLFGAARAVSRNRDPDTAARPFDQRRDGLTMGQGAGALVIETKEHAQRRGATIISEIIGYGENADARGETDPDPDSVVECMELALERTGRRIENVAINPHATSTPIGDESEMKVIRRTFTPDQTVGITAIKSYTGHTFGGAGAVEAVISNLMLRDQIVPAILNLEEQIEEAAGYEHAMNPDRPIEGEIDMVVNNSFGFGGNNAITIFAHPR